MTPDDERYSKYSIRILLGGGDPVIGAMELADEELEDLKGANDRLCEALAETDETMANLLVELRNLKDTNISLRNQQRADECEHTADQHEAEGCDMSGALPWGEADEEVSRLRAELDSSRATHRAVWEKHQQRGQQIFDLQGEVSRLRVELSAAGVVLTRMSDKLGDAEVTIERVREVLDYCDHSDADDLRIEIRAALEGEPS